jgi:hypothetical protein
MENILNLESNELFRNSLRVLLIPDKNFEQSRFTFHKSCRSTRKTLIRHIIQQVSVALLKVDDYNFLILQA